MDSTNNGVLHVVDKVVVVIEGHMALLTAHR
jgi:hypothetical protein